MQAFADEANMKYYETSAKDTINVQEVFEDLARAIKDKLEAD